MRGSLSGVRSRVDRLALKLAPVQVGCPSCRGKEQEPKVVAFKDSAQQKKLPDGATPTKLAAWTLVARVALNLDETITKE